MFNISNYIQWIRKNVSIQDVIILVSIVVLFLLTRLIRLDAFPIFSDEGIYIHWAQVAWKDASWRFISLTDGRQPLQTWGTIPFLKLFPDNLLLGGRLFSVTTGFIALSGMVTSAWYFFGRRAAFFAGLLYVLAPYFLFYDRIALVDSAINAATIWMFFLSVILAKTRRLDVAMILGFVTGFGMLGKSSVRLYAGMMIFAAIFVLYKHKEATILGLFKNLRKKLIGSASENKFADLVSFLLLYGVSMLIALAMYNIQRLSPYMHFVEQKNTTFVMTLPELIANPFSHFPTNIVHIPYYIFAEMAYIVPLLGLVGLYFLYKKNRTLATYFVLWLVVPMIALSFVAKVLFPRYVLSLGGLLVLPAAYLLSRIKDVRSVAGLLAIVVVSVGYFNYTILFRPAQIPFPEVDRGQYLEAWPAGWGIEDIVDFAEEKAQERPVLIIAQGDFGMAGDVLRTHIGFNEDISVKAYWPLKDENLRENQDVLENKHVYVVYGHCRTQQHPEGRIGDQKCETFEDTKPLRLIQKYDKPGNKSAIYLFELLPPQ